MSQSDKDAMRALFDRYKSADDVVTQAREALESAISARSEIADRIDFFIKTKGTVDVEATVKAYCRMS